jgi:hypothetical protein
VIVVDTGIAAPAGEAVHVATHGISRVSAQAAAEWLTGGPQTGRDQARGDQARGDQARGDQVSGNQAGGDQ